MLDSLTVVHLLGSRGIAMLGSTSLLGSSNSALQGSGGGSGGKSD